MLDSAQQRMSAPISNEQIVPQLRGWISVPQKHPEALWIIVEVDYRSPVFKETNEDKQHGFSCGQDLRENIHIEDDETVVIRIENRFVAWLKTASGPADNII